MEPKKQLNPNQATRFSAVIDEYSSRYKTVGQMVYRILRESITSGTFAPGEWLRQEALAEAIGVSRIPVRSALLQLETEGLVTFHPHRGARVRMLSAFQIDEIFRLRVVLEPYALRLSMARMSVDRIERMRELADQLDANDDSHDPVNTRMLFYREVYDSERNPLLVSVIEELRNHVGRYRLRYRVEQDHGGDVDSSLSLHRHARLVELMAAGDLGGAEVFLSNHIQEVWQGVVARAAEAEAAAQDGVADAAVADGGEDKPLAAYVSLLSRISLPPEA